VDKLKAKGNVRGLVKALESGDRTTLIRATKALGELGGGQAVDALVGELRMAEFGRVPRVPLEAAYALGETGDARAVEPLVTLLGNGTPRGREAAACALGKIGDRRAVEPLISALDYKAERVCKMAAEALDRLGWRPDKSRAGATYWVAKRQWQNCAKIGSPAVMPLLTAISAVDESGSNAAIEALVDIGEDAFERLLAALKDGDPNVRYAAAFALGEIGDERALLPLITALQRTDEDETVLPRMAVALGKIGDAEAVEPLTAMLKHHRTSVRTYAAEALGEIGDLRAVRPLVNRLHSDQDARVRGAAKRALKELGWEPETTKPAAPEPAKQRQAEEHLRRGISHSQKENWRPAIEEFRKAVELEPDFAKAHQLLAMSFGAVMDKKNALKHYQTLKKLNPAMAKQLANTPAFSLLLRGGTFIRM